MLDHFSLIYSMCSFSNYTQTLTLFCYIQNTWSRLRSTLAKLMRLDQPPAKIRSKSDSNWLLIDFFDLISAVRSIVATISIRNPDCYNKNSLILIENRSILIEKVWFISKIVVLDIFFDIIRTFRLNNQHLVVLNQSFNRFYIKKDRFISIIYQK